MNVPSECEVVAITGHRSKSFNDESADWTMKAIDTVLTKLHREHGARELNSGMALGSDLWAVKAGLELCDDEGRPTPYQINAYVPFTGQEARWSQYEQALYHRRLAQADSVQVFSQEQHTATEPLSWPEMMIAYHDRNEALVCDADVVVAVSTLRQSGGTAHALQMAVIHGRPVILIDPRRQRRTITVPTHDALRKALEFELDVAAA